VRLFGLSRQITDKRRRKKKGKKKRIKQNKEEQSTAPILFAGADR
jgi:glutaredoxin